MDKFVQKLSYTEFFSYGIFSVKIKGIRIFFLVDEVFVISCLVYLKNNKNMVYGK